MFPNEVGRERHAERFCLVLPVRGEIPSDVKAVLTDFIVTVFDESVVFADFIASFLIFCIDVVEVNTHSISLRPVEAVLHPL